ncbi:hypothetical protein L3Y34_003659 [Caenorhabditis briggsae]|uniref:EGF-like domain-containing protein n=1 Tax=Caenorhabditis briggsae TaxID=6238 RepID=A0AAE9ABX1_CAEBR|nr:hypothetical protein L3Y34_003659 [Caenorhabditis briggsae]
MRATGALVLLFCILKASGERPKITDRHKNLLVKISDIPIGSCGNDSYFGLGIMDGGLEECDRWKLEKTDPEYEEYKCKVLRVHASVKNGKCTCDEKFEGPICNEYHGCPAGETLEFRWILGEYTKVCTQMCQHNGTIAVGKTEIECICPVPWHGRRCERLACWTKTTSSQPRRYRNNGDHCSCGDNYSGENCDIVKSCMNNGQLENGKCNCVDEWEGDVCDKRVSNGNAT